MGTTQKQRQIRKVMEALNWSYRDLADVLYEELFCDEFEGLEDIDSGAIKKLADTLKKQIQRPSTSEERLTQYLDIISEHPSYQDLKLDMVNPKYVEHGCLGGEMLDGLVKLSNSMDELADSNNQDSE